MPRKVRYLLIGCLASMGLALVFLWHAMPFVAHALTVLGEGPLAWRGRIRALRAHTAGDLHLVTLPRWPADPLGIGPGEDTTVGDIQYCTVTYLRSPTAAQRDALLLRYASIPDRPDHLGETLDQIGCSLTLGGYVQIPVAIRVSHDLAPAEVVGFNRQQLAMLWSERVQTAADAPPNPSLQRTPPG